MGKYGHKTGNWHEAVINKHGGEEGAERFLRGDDVIVDSSVLTKYQKRVRHVVLHAKANCLRTPQQALDVTNRKQEIDYTDALQYVPKCDGKEREVVFFETDSFKHDGLVSIEDLEHEFHKRNLKPVDFYSLASINEANPMFADNIPHSTFWKDIKGRCWSKTYYCWKKVRYVHVGLYHTLESCESWFAGTPL